MSSAPVVSSADAVVAAARERRALVQRAGRRRSVSLAASIVGTWAVAMTAFSQWGRAADNVAAAITMVFGSFVAGSTPQGGGAVAFPVFTKVLGVAADDARTFSLMIQAIGMGSASAIIAITRRAVDQRALRLTVPAAIGGFLGGSAVFSAVSLPSPYLKVAFTLLVVAAGGSTWMSRRQAVVEHLLVAPLDHRRTRVWVVVVAALGGVASTLFGSGADVAIYLLLTIVLGVRPGIGVATSVVTMASVSIVGLASALVTGAVDLGSVAGAADVAGMWFAAIPVVVVGAPVGSWFASNVSPAALTRFIGSLAAVELVSTLVFLDELRSDPALATFSVVGLAVTVAGIAAIIGLRDRVAAARRPAAGSIRRLDLEMGAVR